MAKVVLSYSMSLDGFVAGPDVGVDSPMGRGGERLHEWMMGKESGADSQAPRESPRAVVVGRRTYNVGLQFWQDVPYPAPSFVVTHEKRDDEVMKSGAFTFVTAGVERAGEQAIAAAGDGDVIVMGADIAHQ